MTDYIKRADAIEAMCSKCLDRETCTRIVGTCDSAIAVAELPSADRPTEDYSDLPDIPRAYYEKIVGNMSHEINMLKEQLESADAEPTETSTLGEKHQLSHGRLIDADELKKHLDGAWEELNDDGERKGVRLARWYLISAPTVDSTIDVVRCKDCRHCTEYYDRDGYPYWECAEWDGGTDADGYCHYGERREP